MSTLLLAAIVMVSATIRVVLQVDPSADPMASDTSIPWWAQVGLNAGTIGALVSFFIWQNKQVSTGKWYPEPIVVKMLAEKDSTIAGLNTTIAGKDILIEDQRKTIRTQEGIAEANAKAVVQATSNQSWVDIMVRRAIGEPVVPTPKTGDTSSQEVTKA